MIAIQEVVQEVVTAPAVVQPKSHNHVIIALWVFVGISIVEAVVIWILTKARGGWEYIATIPFVNLRQLASLIMAAVTIVGTGIIGFLAGVWPPEYIFHGALIAISVWMGIDVAQYGIKRLSTNPDLPSTQNIMAAQAAAGVPINARDARAAADPTVRQSVPGQTAEQPVPPPAPLMDSAAAIAARSPRADLGDDSKGRA